MRELGIHAVYLTPWTTTTRNSKFDKQLINILDEQFNPLRPNAVWCIDTYIPVHDGSLVGTYLKQCHPTY